MADRPIPQRRWLRFSLATLFFAALSIGALLGGYQSGYRLGYRAAGEDYYDVHLTTEVHNTSGFLFPDLAADDRKKQLDALQELIESTIASEIWSDPRSGAEIHVFPQNQSFVVTAPGSVHKEIRTLFQQLSDMYDHKAVKQMRLVSVLQSLASQGEAQATTIQIATPHNSPLAQEWVAQHFEAAVDSVDESWGHPAYRGACEDPNFPAWSLDQQIATWQRGHGLAYLALRNLDDGHVRLVAGWRQAD
jgi:hypothetical protein